MMSLSFHPTPPLAGNAITYAVRIAGAVAMH